MYVVGYVYAERYSEECAAVLAVDSYACRFAHIAKVEDVCRIFVVFKVEDGVVRSCTHSCVECLVAERCPRTRCAELEFSVDADWCAVLEVEVPSLVEVDCC